MTLRYSFPPDRSSRRKADLLQRLIAKVAELHLLQPGWYFGRGQKIEARAISASTHLIRVAVSEGIYNVSVFPRVEGGVRLDLRRDSHDIEIDVETDGSFAFLHERAGEAVTSVDELSLASVVHLLRNTARRICTFELSIQSTTTTRKSVLVLSPASPRATVFPFSWSRAEWTHPGPFVNTSEPSIQASPVTRPFFGGSMKQTPLLI